MKGPRVAVQVGVAGGSDNEPQLLAELFCVRNPHEPRAAPDDGAPGPVHPQQLGDLLVPVTLWPAQGVQKGSALPSRALSDALARPAFGAHLLVHATPATPGHAGTTARCQHVYLRLCRGAASGALAKEGRQPLDGGLAAEEQQLAAAGSQHVPATLQSTATHGRSGAPSASSPAMRGNAAPVVALSPATSSGNRTGIRPNPNPKRSQTAAPPGTPDRNSTNEGRVGVAARAGQQRRRAKAEALLDMITAVECACACAAFGLAAKLPAFSCMPSHPATSSACVHLSAAEPAPRVRRLVEALLLRQMAGRSFLPGNLVALTVLGQRAVFVVRQLSLEGSSAPSPVAAAAPLLVTATTGVSLLLAAEAVPSASAAGQHEQMDWAAAAAGAAAKALGCSLEDAAARAAHRAAAAGMSGRRIEFEQLGGIGRQVSTLQATRA